MRVVIFLGLLVVFGLLGLAFALRPQEATFGQTEELRGTIAYSGRYADARLGLRTVYADSSFLGGTNGGFAELPNGTEVIARVARVPTLLGEVRVVVKATSAADGRTFIERSPAQCLESWRKSTYSILMTAVLTMTILALGIHRLFTSRTTATPP